MEHAKWKNKTLNAKDVADNYNLEKQVRIASPLKELLCPDEGCKSPTLRYCHGEKKGAYFSHLTNCKCDYADYDKSDNTIIRTIRYKLYDHFIALGYDIQLEKKVLEHHYSHLLITLKENKLLAIEIGTQQTSAKKIKELSTEYNRHRILLRWIIVGDMDSTCKENELYFIKRISLHESKYPEFLLMDWTGENIAQYRWEQSKYEFKDKDPYIEKSSIKHLILDGQDLSIEGFNDRYNAWVKAKKNDSQKEQLPIRYIPSTRSIGYAQVTNTSHEKSYDARKAEIMGKIDQQIYQARDSSDKRWVRCEICGKIAEEGDFSSYGGENHINLGICNDCQRAGRK